MLKKIATVGLLGLAVLATSVWAEDVQIKRDHKSRGHSKPPAAALTACEQKAEGALCEFTTTRGKKLEGACLSREGGPLACRPKHMLQGIKPANVTAAPAAPAAAGTAPAP